MNVKDVSTNGYLGIKMHQKYVQSVKVLIGIDLEECNLSCKINLSFETKLIISSPI